MLLFNWSIVYVIEINYVISFYLGTINSRTKPDTYAIKKKDTIGKKTTYAMNCIFISF